MNIITHLIVRTYSRMLDLYPHRFRDEFAREMQVVFNDSLKDASRGGISSLAALCLRELVTLPINVLREFWHDIKGRETVMGTNESTTNTPIREEKMTRGELILGTLPFALYGLVSMLTKTEFPFWNTYISFFILTLLGLLIGVVKGFPRWTYSYLGWSTVNSWYWSMMPIYIKNVYSPAVHNQLWGWRSWIPLLVTLGIGSLLALSLRPLRQLFRGVWQDWTLLSLAIYAFVSFTSLIYDENHHPYLFAFIAATTIAICLVVWGFLKSDSSWKRVVSLLAGFVAAFVLGNISYATQNYAGYYNLPPSPPQPWYTTAFDGIISWTVLYSGIMYWPALIGLVRHIINNRQKPVMPI